MSIWLAEIKDLKKVYESIRGQLPELEKELERLIVADDENMLLVYSRRCLEVIITDLCEQELKRDRGTEPLQRIIDKLNKEQKVPHNIIVSMQAVNNMSTFGAHPKEFELKQVKPVLSNLSTIIEWYISYLQSNGGLKKVSNGSSSKGASQKNTHSKKGKKSWMIIAGALVVTAIILAILIFSDVINVGKSIKTNAIESLVILPFDNFTGDESLDIVAAGMHAALITDMQQRISGLKIRGKTSSNAFRNTELSLSEIASELNVQAVIEAELVRYSDSIEIHFRLINVNPDEQQRWVNKYKEDKSQLFNLYSRLTKNIADDLKIELSSKEENLLAETRTIHPDALEAYLKGQANWEKLNIKPMQEALADFELATQIAPNWSDPYAGLANVWGLFGFFGILPESVTQPKIDEYLSKALELNPNSAMAHYAKAINETWTKWDWEQGEKEFLTTLELNSNDALAHLYYAHLLMTLHRTDEAVEHANIGLELDPMKPIVLFLYAMVMQNEGEYKSSLSYLRKAISINSDFVFAKGNMLLALYLAGEYEEWIKTWEEKVRFSKRWKEECIVAVVNAFHEGGPITAIEETFRMNEQYGDEGAFMSDGIKLERYLLLGNYEKAIDCMERLSGEKNLNTAYYGTKFFRADELKKYPRYIELLKKMGLPIPKE